MVKLGQIIVPREIAVLPALRAEQQDQMGARES
jgi:hypothetical protein